MPVYSTSSNESSYHDQPSHVPPLDCPGASVATAGRSSAQFCSRHQPATRSARRRSARSMLRPRKGVTGRSYLFCYLRAAAPAIVSLLGEVERAAEGRAGRSAPRNLGQARATFHVDRRAGHRAHGYGRLRCRLLGRACIAAGMPLARLHRRRAAADPGLQQLRTWA